MEINDVVETMQQSNGVGLAALQVGVSLRVTVLQMPGEEPIAIVNPEVVKRSGEQEVNEGCLSVPGYVGEIELSASVTIKGRSRHGKPVRSKATGLMAEALEHEVDHVESQDNLHKIERPIAPEAKYD